MQGLVGVTEAAEHEGARRPVHILQEHAERTLRDGSVGLGRHLGHHVEGIGEWTILLRGQRLEVGCLERDLTGPLSKCVRQLPQEQRVAPGPRHRLRITSAERKPGQQR
jgi:hypothetical protein